MNYKVSEIFYSIQGEGKYVGTPANFLRFSGCNLSCSFCDEPLHKIVSNQMSYNEIKDSLNSDCKHLVITGGEPTLHNLNTLISKLQEDGYFIQIETNGHKLENVISADYITVSPKWGIYENGAIDEYKFVVNKGLNIDDMIALSKSKLVYIQPMADGDVINKENMEYCIDAVKRNPTLKLSLQVHKIIGVR